HARDAVLPAPGTNGSRGAEVQRRESSVSARRVVAAAGGSAVPAAARSGTTANGATPARATKRDLLLKLRVQREGLVCEPWWVDGPGKSSRALAPSVKNGAAGAQGNGNGHGNGNGNGHTPATTASAT